MFEGYWRLCLVVTERMKSRMEKSGFDETDYSVVVKSRAPPPNSWRWEIYRAGPGVTRAGACTMRPIIGLVMF